MSGKPIFVVILLLPFLAQGEVIRLSKLKQERPPFGMKRDIFSTRSLAAEAAADNGAPSREARPPSPLSEEELRREVRTSVSFEGYVMKKERRHALLNVNGEFYVVGEGEDVTEAVKVIKIERERIYLEVEGKKIEIPLKGD